MMHTHADTLLHVFQRTCQCQTMCIAFLFYCSDQYPIIINHLRCVSKVITSKSFLSKQKNNKLIIHRKTKTKKKQKNVIQLYFRKKFRRSTVKNLQYH